MQLSILIPTYNYDCQALIDQLNRQARAMAIEYEIIVLNDASTIDLHLKECIQIDLEQNAGRARGRNILAERARYRYLLFIDSDSMPASQDYLKRWTERAKEGCVIMGGRVYDKAKDREHSLLPNYGKRERNRREGISHAPFTSPNFLIDRRVFERVRFNERFRGYGHEDTIFGIELNRAGIEYSTTDNPVVHRHIESNTEFLGKVRESLDTLRETVSDYPELREISQIERVSGRLNLRCLRFLLPKIERHLRKHGSVLLMQIYKLIYYSTIRR